MQTSRSFDLTESPWWSCASLAAKRTPVDLLLNPRSPSTNYEYQYWRGAENSVHCPFCRLTVKVLSRDLESENLEAGLVNFDCEVLASYRPRAFESPELSIETAIIRYWLLLQVNGKSLTRDQAGTVHEHGIQLLADSGENEENRLLKGRLVDQSQVDMKIINMCICLCEYGHGSGCIPAYLSTIESSNQDPVILHVIKIQYRRIIEAPQNCRYIALSYTWGSKEVAQLRLMSETQARLFTAGCLSDKHADILTTIKDAMNFYGTLNTRYLWADALCIKHDDKDDMNS